MPERIPKIPQSDIASWASLGYRDILKQVLSLYISSDEIPEADIAEMVDGAYGAFDIDEVGLFNTRTCKYQNRNFITFIRS